MEVLRSVADWAVSHPMGTLHAISEWVILLCIVLWLALAVLSKLTAWASRNTATYNYFETTIGLTLNVLIGGVVAFAITGWFLPSNKPRAGDECGANHHWKWVGPPNNEDLSCEEDGR